MTDKKLSMADRIFYEKEIRDEQERKNKAKEAAASYVDRLIADFNKKKEEKDMREREEKQEMERKILINKLNDCD